MDIFDDIIRCLKEEASSTGNVFVRKKDLAEFMGEPIVSRPVQQQAAQQISKQQIPQIEIPEPEQEQRKPMPTLTALPDLSNMGWQELHQCALQCSACSLAPTRKNVVFGCGSQQTELMFIGEGPGADEDEQGVPFVGKAGELLTKMIKAMTYDRSEVYIANIVKCRPPENRNPSDDEAAACLPLLKRQIELVNPKAIVLLGAVPLKYLMGKTGITRQRGNWMEYNGIQVMPTYHPAYLLRNPVAKKDVWQDLQQVMRYLGKL